MDSTIAGGLARFNAKLHSFVGDYWVPISSLIVRTEAAGTDAVVAEVSALAGATVSHVEGQDIVVLTETQARSEDTGLWERIESMHGVNAVELIYHNFEDLEGGNQ